MELQGRGVLDQAEDYGDGNGDEVAEGGGNGGDQRIRLQIVNIDMTGTFDNQQGMEKHSTINKVWKSTQSAMNSYIANNVLMTNYYLLRAVREGGYIYFGG